MPREHVMTAEEIAEEADVDLDTVEEMVEAAGKAARGEVGEDED
ncbi:hypothetical protein SAMN06269185_1637 [Natronoarchaeum philippinense]|uniref:Uncharacterized protein n=1 Tax=Natronoarchaeum philippinense TaxID=558529 RepID=A0A285NS81_NATPI|nr:hypothetical protein SAMN06269185_1637 [Natronoarchaeum philippinense]